MLRQFDSIDISAHGAQINNRICMVLFFLSFRRWFEDATTQTEDLPTDQEVKIELDAEKSVRFLFEIINVIYVDCSVFFKAITMHIIQK